jgi:hypothetical protein
LGRLHWFGDLRIQTQTSETRRLKERLWLAYDRQ